MIKNYIKIAWRNLWKNKTFSFLNITALAIGMGSAILILLWISNEISFDKFHKNKEYIYEAWNRGIFDGKLQCWSTTPKILGPTMKLEFPEIAQFARANRQWFVTSVGDKKISALALITDPSFLSIFSFTLLEGNPQTVLNNLYSMVITEKMAKKMFGNKPAMNQIIKIDRNNFTVTGILKDLPSNTRFEFDYLLPWAFLKKIGEDDAYWGNNSINTFVQLKPNVNPNILNTKIKDIIITHSGYKEEQEVFLHPLSKWHLYTRFENGKVAGGQIETVRMFGIVAIFILLIACINFMILSTARSEKRAKEVGIRKVAGAYKGLLVIQFLGESLFIAIISWMVALMLVQLFISSFNLLVGKQLSIPYTSIYFWLASVLFVAVTAALAGSYPAFYLSSFQPVAVLKGTFKKVNALVTPRKVLVVVQFTFAIVLIISTLVVTDQIRYAQNRDTGYDRSKLIYHFLTGDLNKHYPSLKNELLTSGLAKYISRTSSPLTEGWSDSWDFIWQGKPPDDKTDFDNYAADEGLVKTAGLTIIDGRDMNLSEFPTDSSAMLINEMASKAMGFKNPIGQIVRNGDKQYHVVGVIKDFVLRSPYDPISPMVISGSQGGNMFNVVILHKG